MKRLVIAAALVAGLAAPAAGDVERGLDAYYAEDFVTAAREFRPLAEGGDVTAQYRLGIMYDLGQGVQRDTTQAEHWLRLAAVQGHAEAQFALGLLYEVGRGGHWSPAESRWWIRQAANQGHLEALHWLVTNGECVTC